MKSSNAFWLSFIIRVEIGLVCVVADLVTHSQFWTLHLLACFFMLFSIEPAIFFVTAKIGEKIEAIRSQEQAEKKGQQEPED